MRITTNENRVGWGRKAGQEFFLHIYRKIKIAMLLHAFLSLVCSLAVSFAASEHLHTIDSTPQPVFHRTADYARLLNASLNRFKNAVSEQCSEKIESALLLHSRSLLEDDVYPFENVRFHSRCPIGAVTRIDQSQVPIGRFIINNSKEDTLAPYSNTSLSPETIGVAYILLTHAHANFSYRLLTSLNSSNNVFVVHVDGKADNVYRHLTELAAAHINVYFVQDRQVLTWGGFSIVNATLQAMRLLMQRAIPFDYVVTLSGTSYPIKSNAYIKQVLSRDPHILYMDVLSKPFRPPAHMWHQYIECDGSLHRIARYSLPRGINMYQGSQWFALPRDVVQWLLHSKLTGEFAEYAQYIVVPDEVFFSTLIMNSPYCSRPRQNRLTMLLFDQWENEKPHGGDQKKCVGWGGQQQCGRSPQILTHTQHKHLVQSSWALFARKFDPSDAESMELVNYVDHQKNRVDTGTRWDHSRSPHDQQAIAIKLANDMRCLQFDSRGNVLSFQVCTRKLNQQFATRGCYQASGVNELVCMVQAAGASNECLTVPVKDRKVVATNHPVKMSDCQGTWNQLFHLPERSSTGFIALEPLPQSGNPEQLYCVEFYPAFEQNPVFPVPCVYSKMNQFFAVDVLTTDGSG